MTSRAIREAVDNQVAEVRAAVDRAEEACVEFYRVADELGLDWLTLLGEEWGPT